MPQSTAKWLVHSTGTCTGNTVCNTTSYTQMSWQVF